MYVAAFYTTISKLTSDTNRLSSENAFKANSLGKPPKVFVTLYACKVGMKIFKKCESDSSRLQPNKRRISRYLTSLSNQMTEKEDQLEVIIFLLYTNLRIGSLFLANCFL
nr:unnamed protein product [Callosobruchus analis]